MVSNPLNVWRTGRKSAVERGNVGYDNPRENIDPNIRTKVIQTKEIIQNGVSYDLSTLGGGGGTNWFTSGGLVIFPYNNYSVSGANLVTSGTVSGAIISGAQYRGQAIDFVSGGLILLSGSFAQLSGSFVQMSGTKIPYLSGVVANLSGVTGQLSGVFVQLSGIVVSLSGARVVTENKLLQVSGSFTQFSGAFVTNASGAAAALDHASSGAYLVNVIYGTISATQTASNYPIGTIHIQYIN